MRAIKSMITEWTYNIVLNRNFVSGNFKESEMLKMVIN